MFLAVLTHVYELLMNVLGFREAEGYILGDPIKWINTWVAEP